MKMTSKCEVTWKIIDKNILSAIHYRGTKTEKVT